MAQKYEPKIKKYVKDPGPGSYNHHSSVDKRPTYKYLFIIIYSFL